MRSSRGVPPWWGLPSRGELAWGSTVNFQPWFTKIAGYSPYPYQVALATGAELPDLLSVPTGAGKTAAAVLGWLWRRRFGPARLRATTPRRLVFCLPMRTLVEQTVGCARRWLAAAGLDPDARGAGNMCPACSLFGRMSWRSRIDVGDLRPVDPAQPGYRSIPQQFEPRLHHLGHATIEGTSSRQTFAVTKLHGRKFAVDPGLRDENTKEQTVEAIPERTLLRGEIVFSAIHHRELGGLLAAIGAVPPSPLKLGGGKCYDLGLVQVVKMQGTLRKSLTPFDDALRSACVHAFERDLVVPENLRKLLAIYRNR